MLNDKPAWDIVKAFKHGRASAEVSRAGQTARFSYRVSWADGDRRGPWFPDLGISYLADVAEAARQAEDYILAERSRVLAEQGQRLDQRIAREDDKRRSHEEAADVARKKVVPRVKARRGA